MLWESLLYVPAGHGVQTDWPVKLYVPGRHDWHACEDTLPFDGLYVPGSQERHEELPGVGLYVPAAQLRHEELPDGLYVPIEQIWQFWLPVDGLYGLYVPAWQAKQFAIDELPVF